MSHRFVLAGDSCAGVLGGPHEATFARIASAMVPFARECDFICFLGDHIVGATKFHKPGADELCVQWTRWKSVYAPVAAACSRTFHLTSNHNTFDAVSEEAFREAFPDLPQNGPAEDRGLSYFVKPAEDLLLIATNSASSELGPGRVETDWLAEVLEAHADVPNKLVLGHYPILPVNGYADYPMWRVPPSEGERFWALLVRHGVQAYLCSHIIAFDVRSKEGVLQVCTGGAGTNYGPGGFMRGNRQFHHFVDCQLEDGSLHLSAIDQQARERAALKWPPTALATHIAVDCDKGALNKLAKLDPIDGVRLEFVAQDFDSETSSDHRTLLCGSDLDEGPPTVWIGVEAGRLVAELVLFPGGPVGRWLRQDGPPTDGFAIELRPEFGPGGVFLVDGDGARTTLETSVSETIANIRWPKMWTVSSRSLT